MSIVIIDTYRSYVDHEGALRVRVDDLPDHRTVFCAHCGTYHRCPERDIQYPRVADVGFRFSCRRCGQWTTLA